MREVIRILLWPILLPFKVLDRYYHHLVFGVCSSQTFQGFTLYAVEDAETFFNKAIASLTLLQYVDPRRYRRVQQYLPVIAYVRLLSGYNRWAHAYYLYEMPDDDKVYFASQIVHEATRGFLIERGFHYKRNVRERHERICSAEQLRFIVRSIAAQQNKSDEQKQALAQKWTEWFDRQLASEWWSDKAFHKRQSEALKDIWIKHIPQMFSKEDRDRRRPS